MEREACDPCSKQPVIKSNETTWVIFFVAQRDSTFVQHAKIQNSVVSLMPCLYRDGERAFLSKSDVEHVGITLYCDEQEENIQSNIHPNNPNM